MTVDDFVKVATVLSPMILAYIAYLGVRAARKVDQVAVKVEQVARTAEGSDRQREELIRGQEQIKITTEATHKLVNSERGTTLRLLMLAYQRATERDDATSVDRELYAQARTAYEDHMEGQAQVDNTLAREGPG